MLRRLQALILVALLMIGSVCPSARAVESATARQLLEECERLIASAVKRPYGWGWADAGEDPATSRAPIINLDPAATAAAGLALYHAGTELKNNQLHQAARNVARALIAAQEPRGRIPARIIFSNTPRTRDAIAAIPGRAPTCAALALLLTVAQDGEADEPLRRGAARAALWLSQQQTPSGSWPTTFTPRPGAPAQRLVRLDTTDYRDCTLAMLLASQSLADARFKFAATRAGEQLLRLRIQKSRTASGLWHSAYDLSGDPSHKASPGGPAVDTLATQYALQALLALHVAFDSPFANAIHDAAARLDALRINDKWRRFYPLTLGEIPPESLVAPAPDPLTPPDRLTLDAFNLPRLLAAAAALKTRGREHYQALASISFAHSAAIPLTICGLHDQPFDPNAPSVPSAVRTAPSEYANPAPLTHDPVPVRLEDQVRRLQGLLLQLKLQRISGNIPAPDTSNR